MSNQNIDDIDESLSNTNVALSDGLSPLPPDLINCSASSGDISSPLGPITCLPLISTTRILMSSPIVIDSPTFRVKINILNLSG